MFRKKAAQARGPLAVVREVIDTLDTSVDDDDKDKNLFPIEQVFAHTLYRYLVMMIAAPDFSQSFLANERFRSSKIGNILITSLDLDRIVEDLSSDCVKKRDVKKSASVQCFEKDVSQWSINVGTSPVMERVRRQLFNLGEGSDKLLFSMLNWDPALRYVLLVFSTVKLFLFLPVLYYSAFCAQVFHA